MGASYASTNSGARVSISPGPDVGLCDQPGWSCHKFHDWVEGVATRWPGAEEEIVGSQEETKDIASIIGTFWSVPRQEYLLKLQKNTSEERGTGFCHPRGCHGGLCLCQSNETLTTSSRSLLDPILEDTEVARQGVG